MIGKVKYLVFNKVKGSIFITLIPFLMGCSELTFPSINANSSESSLQDSISESTSYENVSSDSSSFNNVSTTNTESSESTTSPGNSSEIKTTQDLKNIQNNLSGTYTLMNDISLSGSWTPLGNGLNPFTGIFDGNGFTIRNLTITKTQEYVGLFSYNMGTIKNLNLSNIQINLSTTSSSTIYVGAFVAYNSGLVINVKTLSGFLYVGEQIQNQAYVGGIIGLSNNPTSLNNLVNKIDVISNNINSVVGGLVGEKLGYSENALFTLANSSNHAEVVGGDANIVGGLIGRNASSSITILNSFNKETVYSSRWAGGLIGEAMNAIIRNSMNSGFVAGDSGVGGLIGIGKLGVLIEQSLNSGSIQGTNRVGGLVGNTTLTFSPRPDYIIEVNHSLNAGEVLIGSNSRDLGGIVGFISGGASTSFTHAYYSGKVLSASRNEISGTNFGIKWTDINALDFDFFTKTLKWETEIWDFTGLDIANAVYPTLKDLPIA